MSNRMLNCMSCGGQTDYLIKFSLCRDCYIKIKESQKYESANYKSREYRMAKYKPQESQAYKNTSYRGMANYSGDLQNTVGGISRELMSDMDEVRRQLIGFPADDKYMFDNLVEEGQEKMKGNISNAEMTVREEICSFCVIPLVGFSHTACQSRNFEREELKKNKESLLELLKSCPT